MRRKYILACDEGMEEWKDDADFRLANDGWGMCKADIGGSDMICTFGGIGCNVNHVRVKRTNDQEAASCAS
jgi:hypothetical protein